MSVAIAKTYRKCFWIWARLLEICFAFFPNTALGLPWRRSCVHLPYFEFPAHRKLIKHICTCYLCHHLSQNIWKETKMESSPKNLLWNVRYLWLIIRTANKVTEGNSFTLKTQRMLLSWRNRNVPKRVLTGPAHERGRSEIFLFRFRILSWNCISCCCESCSRKNFFESPAYNFLPSCSIESGLQWECVHFRKYIVGNWTGMSETRKLYVYGGKQAKDIITGIMDLRRWKLRQSLKLESMGHTWFTRWMNAFPAATFLDQIIWGTSTGWVLLTNWTWCGEFLFTSV